MGKRQKRLGFTLMELLIVVAIIAVLVAIAIPIFTKQLERSREATDTANMRAAYAVGSVAKIGEEIEPDTWYSYDISSSSLVLGSVSPYGQGTTVDGGYIDEGGFYDRWRTTDLTSKYILVRYNSETESIDVTWQVGLGSGSLVSYLSNTRFAQACNSNNILNGIQYLAEDYGLDVADYSIQLSNMQFTNFEETGYEGVSTGLYREGRPFVYNVTFTTDGTAQGRVGETVEVVRYWYCPYDNGKRHTILVEQRGTAVVKKSNEDGTAEFTGFVPTATEYVGPEGLVAPISSDSSDSD